MKKNQTDNQGKTQVNMKVPDKVHFDVRRLCDLRNASLKQSGRRYTIHEVYVDAIVAGLNVLEQ